MARPRTSTEVMDGETLELFREVFGTCVNAYARLGVSQTVTYWVFQSMWRGGKVSPGSVVDVRSAWDQYAEGLVRKIRRPA